MTAETICPQCQQSFMTVNDLGQPATQCPLCGFDVAPPDKGPGGAAVKPSSPQLAPPPTVNAAQPPLYAESLPATTSESLHASNMISLPRYVVYSQGGLLAVVAIAAFVLGAGFGGLYSGQTPTTAGPSGACEIEGRITRVRADGTESGTAALVIFLPAERQPDEKWSHHGLRPELDLPPTDHRALVGIRLLGGAYVKTDARGHYRAKVAAPGEYFALVMAESVAARDDPWNRRDLAQLGRYFVDAMGLLAGTEYRWQQLTVTPGEQWDVAFQNP